MTEAPAKLTPTRNTRVAGDLGEKLEQILDVLGQSAAEYLDPLIRKQIENDHRANASAIAALRKARERVARNRDEAPVLANDLGEAGA
jgi:hypothetical protein